MDILQNMKIFVRVAEAGSFTGAASHMKASTSSVSRSIGALETHLRARLFNRSTRHVALTEVGERYLRRCEQLLASIDEAEAEAADAQARPSGRLRVHSPTSFGQTYIVPAIVAFRKQYPAVTVDLTLSQQVPDMIDEGYDVSLQLSATMLPNSALISRPLGEMHSVLCASPSYLVQSGTPRKVADLVGHQCVPIVSSLFPPDVWLFDGPHGDEKFHLPPASFLVNGAEPLAIALRHGAGIGAVPMSTALPELRRGALVRVLPNFTLQPLTVHVLYASRQYLDAKIKTFVEALRAQIPRALESDKAMLAALR
ncbi:LysR family transcriptional regulator [Burkholderia lata]|uniref:LysR family transcriptional regulator n=1 Tax=Burkholderia lata (strain ATCC 17760 / DSM 23089 / LMG 22485 / NCIMB 9086 / R18194 / 383) TaxID=482957 RepID=A0A6P2KY62_BURL3|nr:LysR family transcriptional regulator [Burkholderia lata]VWB59775.1 LysR family transcriptional regulator [Burkholderia lata]